MRDRRKQVQARLELHRRIQQTRQLIEDYGWREEKDPLPIGTQPDTRTLYNEARDLLIRLEALTDRDVDAAIGEA